MKFVFALLRLVTLLLVASFLIHFPKPHPVPAPIQQRATHMIRYVRGSRTVGVCTGTAIGPHAILTASHCDDDGEITTVEFDLSTRTYHIQKILSDSRDHDIYLVDGPAFYNLVEYKARPSRLGEHVYLYGNGEAQYPARRLDGNVAPFDDPSDVSVIQGQEAFTLEIIPGDSGSAVFADDGSIVAISTYSWRAPHSIFDLTPKVASISFALDFTPEQIKSAVDYVPVKNAVEPKSPPQLSLFDLINR